MKIEIKPRSTKKTMPIDDIKISECFLKTPPDMDKLIHHAMKAASQGEYDPIIVDSNNTLIDGYISYLIHKHIGYRSVTVFKITTTFKEA